MGGSVPSAKPYCSRSTAGSTRHSPTSSREPWGTACMSSQRAVASCTLPHLQRMDPMPACAAQLSADSTFPLTAWHQQRQTAHSAQQILPTPYLLLGPSLKLVHA